MYDSYFIDVAVRSENGNLMVTVTGKIMESNVYVIMILRKLSAERLTSILSISAFQNFCPYHFSQQEQQRQGDFYTGYTA